MEITDDTLTIHLESVPEVDAFTFPPPPTNGITPFRLVPATILSLDITYRKSGKPRRIRPTSHDPLSPFNWAGEMWEATNSGTFSLKYDDDDNDSFSASGSFSSSGNFGEMGTERNGSFLRAEDFDKDGDGGEAEAEAMWQGAHGSEMAATRYSADANAEPQSAPRLKGRFLLHREK